MLGVSFAITCQILLILFSYYRVKRMGLLIMAQTPYSLLPFTLLEALKMIFQVKVL